MKNRLGVEGRGNNQVTVGSETFPCGHARTAENSYKNRSGSRCRECTIARLKITSAAYRQTEQGKHTRNIWQKKYARKIREEMITAYGGSCQCCGESAYEFLTLEHLNGGGNAERRLYGGGRNSGSAGIRILLRLRKEGWPKDKYTVLCANCNMATKGGRVCPHQTQTKLRLLR